MHRKTRDLFKKIRDTNGTFHAKMGSIKDRNDGGLVAESDLTLSDPMDTDSALHGIIQARILEQLAISFSRGSTQPRD